MGGVEVDRGTFEGGGQLIEVELDISEKEFDTCGLGCVLDDAGRRTLHGLLIESRHDLPADFSSHRMCKCWPTGRRRRNACKMGWKKVLLKCARVDYCLRMCKARFWTLIAEKVLFSSELVEGRMQLTLIRCMKRCFRSLTHCFVDEMDFRKEDLKEAGSLRRVASFSA